jgi:crotonobetainyl-CoA:carnitine CoA-transferase CaiB-like acyl-CoA transferase
MQDDDRPISKPLTGKRILTVEQFGAGPYATQYFADLGAEVIKLENSETKGDASRHIGPFMVGENDSLYFQGWHTNKKSVTINLKSEEGQRHLKRLVEGADAIINNLRGDQAAKLGLDYKALSSVNPRIVCGHISAYGRDNERAGRPGYDFLMQAEAGLMSLTGDPDGDPARFGPSIIDFMTGMTLSMGVLSCIIRAMETGKGCDVDTCLFDVALHQLNYSGTWYLNAGYKATRQMRSSHLSATPCQTFKASDGWIFVMCMTEKFWQLLAKEIGLGHLIEDPRFATVDDRRARRAELTELLDAVFQTNTTEYWVERLGSLVPIAPVYDIEHAVENPFVSRVGMVSNVPHPDMPNMQLLSNPLRFDGERPKQKAGSALGADNDTYLD